VKCQRLQRSPRNRCRKGHNVDTLAISLSLREEIVKSIFEVEDPDEERNLAAPSFNKIS